ncbi:MAG: ATP-binding cassette domain-containing protein [Mycobacteriales bacterium]
MTGRRPAAGTWALVAGALRDGRRDLCWLAAWSAVEAAPAYVLGRAVAGAVDGFGGGRPGTGVAWLVALVVAAALGAVGSWRCYPRLAAVVEPFRNALVRRVTVAAVEQACAPAVGAGADTGASVSRLTHQVEVVRDSFAGLLTVSRTVLFTSLGALAGLASLAPVTLVVVLPPFAAGLALFGLLVLPMARAQRAYVLADEAVAAEAGLAAGALRDVVACGAEERQWRAAARPVAAQAAAARRLAVLSALRVAVLAVGGWLPVVLLLAAAPWLSRHGVSRGGIVGALAYLVQGLNPALHTLAQGLTTGGLRLAVTLNRIVTATAPAPAPAVEPVPAGTSVELTGVTFAYGDRARPVLRDLDLTVRDGDHLAIVGPSGVGKSTLAAILTGMLTPQRGRVRRTGGRVFVPQEAYVFTGTVRENLAYLCPDGDPPPPERLAAVLAGLGLEPLVDRIGGLDATLDPAALSAGERALVALARAYLAPAWLVVLDEATSPLDAAAEARAEELFAARPGALVVVAHRISSATRARRVLVLDGDRVALGTHAELVTSSPLYRELVGAWQVAPQLAPTTEPAPETPVTASRTGPRS